MSNYNLLNAKDEILAAGTFEEVAALEREKRDLGDCALFIVRSDCESDWINARAFYTSDGSIGSKIVDSDDAILGFCAALADYPDGHKSIGSALRYYKLDDALIESLLDRADRLLKNQTEWFRWPSLPLR